MKQKIYSEGAKKVALRGFPGIDLRYPLDGMRGAAAVDNFRIGKDGSLVGRGGFDKISHFQGGINGLADLGAGIFFCSGNKVYNVDRATGAITGGDTSQTLSNSDGQVGFFESDGQVYVGDGESVKAYDKTTGALRKVNGYAPLIGKLWDPQEGGEFNESENLASNRIRISYLVTSATNMLYTKGYVPESIDLVEMNDDPIDSGRILFNEDECALEGPDGCFTEGIVTVWMTFRTSPQNSAFATAKYFAKAGTRDGEVLFAYGATGSGGTAYPYVFASSAVSEADMDEAARAYSVIDRLYFPASGRFLSNTGSEPVTGICPLDDRVLLFTGSEMLTFAFPSEGEICPVPSGFFAGCANAYSIVKTGSSVITASKDGAFLITPDRQSFADFRVERISDPLGSRAPFPNSEDMSLFHSKLTDELFFVNCGFTSGKTPVYSLGSKRFYTFSGFSPLAMLVCAGQNCFFDGTRLCGFSDSRTYDVAVNSITPVTIKKEYRSCLIPVADPGKVRRPSRIGLTAALENGSATLTLLDAAGKTVSSHTLNGVQNVPYVPFSVRPARQRGAFFAFSLKCESGVTARIFDLMLEAEE